MQSTLITTRGCEVNSAKEPLQQYFDNFNSNFLIYPELSNTGIAPLSC